MSMVENDRQTPQGPLRQPDAAPKPATPEPDAARPETSGQKPESLIPALMELAARSDRVAQTDRELGKDVAYVLRTATDTARHADTSFRRDVATALQDTEKALGE